MTTARTTAPPDTVSRRARTATIGATLWTLSAGVWAVSDLEYQEPGSLGFVAVAVAWWICMVLAPALIVVGHAVARRLSLSPKTVANYVSAIFAKLQVADRAEAMIRAREAGLG